jgi:hypothetical protein
MMSDGKYKRSLVKTPDSISAQMSFLNRRTESP